MSRLIDHALLLALLAILAGLAAHILSLTAGAVLTSAVTPIAGLHPARDALDHVLKIYTWRRG